MQADRPPTAESEINADKPPPSNTSLLSPPESLSRNDSWLGNGSAPLSPTGSRPVSPGLAHLVTGKDGPKGSRRSRKAAIAANSAPQSSGDEASPSRPKGKREVSKKMRKWGADGMADEDDGTVLDYSVQSVDDGAGEISNVEAVAQDSWGSTTSTGQFVLKDVGDEMDEILASANSKEATTMNGSTGLVGTGLGAIGGLFRNVIGGKTLTKEDLAKPLKGMEDHLLKKNVAREAAVRLCESVEQDLVGTKTGNFTSKDSTNQNPPNLFLKLPHRPHPQKGKS